jgi:hypothetical protein
LPRAPSRAARATDAGAVLVQAVEFVNHGAQRLHHVVARVPVGDGEDVEVVHLMPARLEEGARGSDHLAEPGYGGVGHACSEAMS